MLHLRFPDIGDRQFYCFRLAPPFTLAGNFSGLLELVDKRLKLIDLLPVLLEGISQTLFVRGQSTDKAPLVK